MSERWTSTSAAYLLPRAPGERDAWSAEAGSRGSQRLAQVGTAKPPEEIRSALNLGSVEHAIARRRVIYLDASPVELADSYYPRHVADGTGLAEHAKIRGGAPTLLAELGYTPSRVIEEVEQRPATADEAELLQIPPGNAVLTLLRVSLTSTEEPYEASLMIMRGPRRLRYEMEVN